MENVADALQIVAFVLIFVVALSISVNAFGQARQTSQIILDYKDREYDYTYVEELKKADGTSQLQRIVTAETIIPSIYKAYKENYKIEFIFNDDTYLYKKGETDLNANPICYIDLEKEVLGSNERKEYFIEGILYGEDQLKAKYGDDIIKNKINSDIHLNPDKLYDTIKGRRFQEDLGVYYQEELEGTSDTPEANKTKKRVITYTEQ